MSDFNREIHEFIDAGATPVTAEEAKRLAPRMPATPDPRPKRSFRRISVISPVAVLCASVMVVVGITITPSGLPTNTQPASAAAFLNHVADEAASQRPLVPGPGQYLYVRTLIASQNGSGSAPNPRVWRYYVQEIDETWTSPHGFDQKRDTVVAQPQFISGIDRTTWEEDGSPLIESGWGGGGTPAYFNVSNLPTETNRVRAFLDRQPASLLPVIPTRGRDAFWEFDAAVQFLQKGASSKQRAALLHFMATLRGVRYGGRTTTLGTHEVGTLLSMPSVQSGMTYEVVFNPNSSLLLESRTMVTDQSKLPPPPDPESVAEGRAIAPLANGEAEYYDDLLFIGISSTTGTPPSNAPPLPTAWVYGTGREPIPGSAFP